MSASVWFAGHYGSDAAWYGMLCKAAIEKGFSLETVYLYAQLAYRNVAAIVDDPTWF